MIAHPNPSWKSPGAPNGSWPNGQAGPHTGVESVLLNRTLSARPFPRMSSKGLGAGTAAGEAAGGAILSTAAVVTAVNPVAGAIVAAVGAMTELVSSFIGGGCGQACVNSAEAEQIYEVAGDDLAYVARLGMLTDDEYSTGMQNIISAGTQHMQTLAQSDPSATKGLQNMLKSLPASSLSGFSPPVSNPGSVPLDMSAAQAAFKQPGASGWYAGSVSAGNQLAAAYLNALAQLQSNGVNTGNVQQALTSTAATAGSPTAPVALAPGTSTQLVTTSSGLQVPVTTTAGSTATATTGLSTTDIAIGAAVLLAIAYFIFGRD